MIYLIQTILVMCYFIEKIKSSVSCMPIYETPPKYSLKNSYVVILGTLFDVMLVIHQLT